MKINVMISESAGFTPAQEKKIVLGAKLIEHKISRRAGGGGVSFGKSKIQHTVTKVDLTKAGAIKSVTTEGAYVVERSGKVTTMSGQDYTFTPTQLSKLLDAPIPKVSDSKPGRAIRFGDAVGEKAQNSAVEKSIKALDAQIAELQAKRKVLQAKVDKQEAASAKETAKAKEMNLAEKGIYFSVELGEQGRAGESKQVKPTLNAARKVRPKLTGSGTIVAVVNKKRVRVMTFASTDPITKKSIKGKDWFFVNKAAQTKFG